MGWHKTTIGILILVSLIAITACKKNVTESEPETDSPPNIYSQQPIASILNQKIGDTVTFQAIANDADDDPIEYKTLIDGIKISDANTFEFIIGEIGSFLIQIIAYNTEADTAEWQVNVENQVPVINSLGNVTDNEDEVEIGSIVHTPTISDNEDSLEDLILELTQTNPDLIILTLDDNYNIIVESYQANGNGSSDITLSATDPDGLGGEASFTFTVNPMSDISGRILDTDTQEPNTTLQAWIVVNGETSRADNQGNYSIQIEPTSELEIQAGYKQNGAPISYVTTVRDIDATNDMSDFDIAVVTYLNMNTTLEEFRIMMNEANAKDGEIRALMKDMVWYLIKRSPRYDIQGVNTLLLSLFSDEEWTKLQELVNIMNNYLKNPLPIILEEINGYPESVDERIGKIIIVKRYDAGLGSIVVLDYDNDSIVDFVRISLMYPVIYPGIVYEEGASALVGFDSVRNTTLAGGKTIFYESETIDIITDADIKAIRMIENITFEVGNLWPKMPIDDILKLQE